MTDMEERMLKRFVIFAGWSYEDGGGWDNILTDPETGEICSFNELSEALDHQNARMREKFTYDWSHVADLQTGEMHGH